MRELNVAAKLFKGLGIGGPIGKIWSFLVAKAAPVTQAEIERELKYSRGLISRALKKLRELKLITVVRKGKNLYYEATFNLTKGFEVIIKHFVNSEISPTLKALRKKLTKLKDESSKKAVRRLIKEYEALRDTLLILANRASNALEV